METAAEMQQETWELCNERRHRQQVDRPAHHPSRRRRQGHGPRGLRRRHHHARHDLGQGAAQPAPARADQVDRHLEGRGVARRQGGGHRARTSSTSRSTSRSCSASRTCAGCAATSWRARRRCSPAIRSPPSPPPPRRSRREACKLIEVEYEVLPWSIEIDDAIKPDAPILHDFIKFEGKPSNIAGKLEVKKGDVAQGFAEADDRDRAQLHHPPGASGLYRAARLPGQRRRRRQDHDLELEPGPVHGPRHDLVC